MEHKKQQAEDNKPNAELMKAAKVIRGKANSMTDDQREDSFRRGMQLIYGGTSGNATAKVGRC